MKARDGSMTERLTLAENLFEDTGKKTKHTTEIVGYEGCPPPHSSLHDPHHRGLV